MFSYNLSCHIYRSFGGYAASIQMLGLPQQYEEVHGPGSTQA